MKVRPLLKNPDEVNDPPRPFFEHIVALRESIIHAAIAWIICAIVAAIFSKEILGLLSNPLELLNENAGATVTMGGVQLTTFDLPGGFAMIMDIALWGGTALSFPFVVYFVLRFIFPALTKREKVAILFFLVVGAAFFGVGVLFAFRELAPNVVRFFVSVNNWLGLPALVIRVESYVPLILKLVLAFGLVFQIPLIMFVLGWLGVVSSDTLRGWRKFAIVFSFVLGMVLTPPDPMSQMMLALPLCLLYEISIWAVWLKEVCTGERWRSKKEDK